MRKIMKIILIFILIAGLMPLDAGAVCLRVPMGIIRDRAKIVLDETERRKRITAAVGSIADLIFNMYLGEGDFQEYEMLLSTKPGHYLSLISQLGHLLKNSVLVQFRATTNSKHDYPVWPNILNRSFTVEKPNTVWASDITYIWTLEGWLYLAATLDLFSRGVVGLAMDKNITDTLTQTALTQAILRRNPSKGLICHSDRGSQYAGNDFKALLANHEFVGSMSKKGDCWDNAVAESFFHTLKVELVHRMKFRTREEAKIKIFKYIEIYYNRKRAHSTLGYLSPFEYERQALLTKQTVH